MNDFIVESFYVYFSKRVSVCFKQVWQNEIFIISHLSGRGPSGSRNAPTPSLSLILADVSGL